ncbi:unnamed protein product, partial [Discosporangium mesarthrocarpum]
MGRDYCREGDIRDDQGPWRIPRNHPASASTMNEATAFTLARVLGLVAQDVLTLESVDPVSFNLGQRISINFHYDPVGVAIKVIIPSQSPEEASRNHERDAVEVAQLGQEPQSMCSICFDMKVEGDLLQCSGGGGCGCKFCRCCMEKHVLTSVGNGVIVPRCPGVCCERALHEEEIELYAGGGEEGTKLLRRLASMRESRAVDTDPLASWCPNSLCSSVCRRASKREMRVECSSCTSVFCGSCCQFWEDCSKPHSLRCSGKLRDPRREMSQRREKTGSTRCPCCRIPIELERGALRPVSSPCARLQCPSCKHDFCRHC